MKKRADELVFERGHADSRTKAQALILAGQVRFKKNPDAAWELVKKAGQPLAVDTELDVALSRSQQDVGRGALKMRGAFAQWPELRAHAQGAQALDIGSSTGGFTQVLLEEGASRVLALDVGTHQLHERLRQDARVISLEEQHVLQMTDDVWNRVGMRPPFDFIVTDVSFISITKLVSTVAPWLRPGAPWIVLLKPQFEVGPKKAPQGIVRDPKYHQEAIALLKSSLETERSLRCRAVCDSPIAGGEGNKEFLTWIEKKVSPL